MMLQSLWNFEKKDPTYTDKFIKTTIFAATSKHLENGSIWLLKSYIITVRTT